MTTCFGKSSAFGLLCVSFLGDCVVVFFFCECLSFHFGFEVGLWDLIVSVPDHCLRNIKS